ncbi:MAG: hypothetical protein JSS09_04165 [Verrucomicrobia bacterium]|nr:hypothetical protein [Verrucomicrobiota bacterium]
MPEISSISPLSPQTVSHPEVTLESPAVSPDDEISNSPFSQMFRGGATKEELRHFINNCLYTIIQECKRADAAAKRASRRYLCAVTGRRYD